MKKRLFLLVALAVLTGLAGLVAWGLAGEGGRKRIHIRAADTAKRLGFGLRDSDAEHVRRLSGLADISNVNCADCHDADTTRLAWARSRRRHSSPEGLAISADGRKLYVALADTDEVVAIDTATWRTTRRVRVAGTPRALALAPDGKRLYASCASLDRIAVLDATSLSELGGIEVGISPTGLTACRTTSGERLVVANAGSDDVSVIDSVALQEIARLPVGREPYAVTASSDGSRVWVACRLANIGEHGPVPAEEVAVIDPAAGRLLRHHSIESAHLSEAIATMPARGWVMVPVVHVRNLLPITQVALGWVMSSGVALLFPGAESMIQIPLDEANAYYADPAGLAVDANGSRAYIASAGGDVITVLDLESLDRWLGAASADERQGAIHDLELSSRYVIGRIPTRRNPRQLVLSPDGRRLFVAERLASSVLVIDTQELKELTRIQLGDPGDSDPIRRGERVFTSASRTFQGQFSCRSCHPDGQTDGLTYDFDGDGIGDNMLDNRSLQGLDGTWPFKWNGRNPSLQVQCGPRFAKVLMRTEPFTDDQLDDLAAFILSLPPSRTVPASRLGAPPTDAQERGRALFFATNTPTGGVIAVERRCQTCHTPPLYTNRQRTKVGTRGPLDTTDEFDTPHLLGIAATAPYLHDGRAGTLKEVFTEYQTNDVHGVTSYMDEQQLDDLIEFLKSL